MSGFHDEMGFYASGSSGTWAGRLTEADMADYAARLSRLLPPEDAAWLNRGDRGGQDG